MESSDSDRVALARRIAGAEGGSICLDNGEVYVDTPVVTYRIISTNHVEYGGGHAVTGPMVDEMWPE